MAEVNDAWPDDGRGTVEVDASSLAAWANSLDKVIERLKQERSRAPFTTLWLSWSNLESARSFVDRGRSNDRARHTAFGEGITALENLRDAAREAARLYPQADGFSADALRELLRRMPSGQV